MARSWSNPRESWDACAGGGYYIVWWIGDHAPRHVHIFDADDRFLGRVAIPSGEPLDDWKPTRKLLQILAQLIKEGRL